ncbi:hypothetical protein F5Y15DRAFT_41320 [Xylariaceae sp. FL0016]|nr:hypothetical protein F5Y15DRAFT_41320 [Xylariaceae sp. FL0016]
MASRNEANGEGDGCVHSDLMELLKPGYSSDCYQMIFGDSLPTNERIREIIDSLLNDWAVQRDELNIAHIVGAEAMPPIPVSHEPVIKAISMAFRGSTFCARFMRQIGLFRPSNIETTAESGDEVWVVLGRPKPLILRPQTGPDQGHFSLIGSVVVPALMDGEVMDAYVQGKVADGVHLDDVVQSVVLF